MPITEEMIAKLASIDAVACGIAPGTPADERNVPVISAVDIASAISTDGSAMTATDASFSRAHERWLKPAVDAPAKTLAPIAVRNTASARPISASAVPSHARPVDSGAGRRSGAAGAAGGGVGHIAGLRDMAVAGSSPDV